MKYMLLLAGPEDTGDEAEPTEEEWEAIFAPWFAYEEQLREAGVEFSGEALQPTTTATTVRVRNDQTLLTDGPYAESREVLGGFYLIEVEDLDEALAWAARCPGALEPGGVEVRPVMDVPGA